MVRLSNYLILFGFLLCGQVFAQSNQEMFPPENIGGKKELHALKERNIFIPSDLQKLDLKGIVKLSFVVNENGMLENIQFVEKLNPELDEQTLQILKTIQWKPGVVLGRAYRTNQEFEMAYSNKTYSRIVKKRGYENPGDYPPDTDSTMHIYDQVDNVPMAGDSRFWLTKFLSENLKYPTEAFNRNISGTVILSFVVEPYGRISNLDVTQSVGGGCDEEALRLISMIKWQPAHTGEHTVRYKMTLPITFNLN